MAATPSKQTSTLTLIGEGPPKQILTAFNGILDLRQAYILDRQKVEMTSPCYWG